MPVRGVVDVFACTPNGTAPSPVEPDVHTVTHDTGVVTIHDLAYLRSPEEFRNEFELARQQEIAGAAQARQQQQQTQRDIIVRQQQAREERDRTVADLRNRVLFTLAMLGVYRIGNHIPTPGVNTQALAILARGVLRVAQVGVVDGRISRLYFHSNPDKLTRLALPAGFASAG